jgi:hypothetical protein
MVDEPKIFLDDEHMAEILEYVPSYYAMAAGPFGANFNVKYIIKPNLDGVIEAMEMHKKEFDKRRDLEYDPDQWHVFIGHQNFN